jgi:hypothetical protein
LLQAGFSLVPRGRRVFASAADPIARSFLVASSPLLGP